MFRVGDLFEVEGTKSLDAGTLEFKDTGVNFVGRTDENNDIQGKIDKVNANIIQMDIFQTGILWKSMSKQLKKL